MAIPPFGSPPTPDASPIRKGKVRLAGALAGTADSPELADVVVGGTVGSATAIPVITFNDAGQITSTTTATPVQSLDYTIPYFMGG